MTKKQLIEQLHARDTQLQAMEEKMQAMEEKMQTMADTIAQLRWVHAQIILAERRMLARVPCATQAMW